MVILKKVDCSYCEFFDFLYKMRYPTYIMFEYGVCNKKEKCRSRKAHICENFKLRQGLYTKKWYPGKKGEF